MLREQATVEEIIRAYAQAINDQGIQVEKVLLFGSYARGDAKPDSDIALIIVSRDFHRMPAWKRWEILGNAAAKLMEPIEALARTPDELALKNLGPVSFLRQVLTQHETVELSVLIVAMDFYGSGSGIRTTTVTVTPR
ncbi:MAG TPA: nucleotidyltransferase domain-containing protein [Spirochaetia bacterium]|nr:nucleotidyltransferase domain-containing protein [Spirochaetia bacterium]